MDVKKWLEEDHGLQGLADLDTWEELIALFQAAIAQDRAEREEDIARYKQWVNDLQSGMYINCVYCGHRYGPNSSARMDDVLKKHIENCPEHPMSALKKQLDDLRADSLSADLERLKEKYGEQAELSWYNDKKQWGVCVTESDLAAILTFYYGDTPDAAVGAAKKEIDDAAP